ncbi:MAG TPA: hypothetical protein VFS05_12575 [Gemmatimonadaceae bacterium]|nr:hypothetical protein [Gemmatimonadaceae bacterium]
MPVLLLGLAAAASLAPLADPDLPNHLAMGEWIARHRAVPTVEPFAWTRPGAPYFAYSWLAQTAMYGLLRFGGPLVLHLLAGILLACASGAVLLLGRVEGWRPWPAFAVAAVHGALAVISTPWLRPQLALWMLVPLAWAAVSAGLRVDRAANPRAIVAPLLALWAIGAVAAGTHILFPITAAPLALVVMRTPLPWRRGAALAAALGAGWLTSPYAFDWPAVFRLNFTPNALFGFPSPITEYIPGFIRSAGVGAVLGLLPWLALDGRSSWKERLVYGGLWVVGLIAFGQAVKGLVVWWLVSLPLAARAAARLPDPSTRMLASARATLFLALAILPGPRMKRSGERVLEGTVAGRTLPTADGALAEPAAAWLQRHLAVGVTGRALTYANGGSYLVWRLPAISPSVDARTIFPDSAALPEALRPPGRNAAPLGPWRSADLAIVPTRFPVAAVLDTATGWRRVPLPDSARVGLWVTERWAERALVPPDTLVD